MRSPHAVLRRRTIKRRSAGGSPSFLERTARPQIARVRAFLSDALQQRHAQRNAKKSRHASAQKMKLTSGSATFKVFLQQAQLRLWHAQALRPLQRQGGDLDGGGGQQDQGRRIGGKTPIFSGRRPGAAGLRLRAVCERGAAGRARRHELRAGGAARDEAGG
jgi:hypothetical protein